MKKLIATLTVVLFANQASAEDAVYEFKDKNVELFLACEEFGEEFMIALNRTDSDWKIRSSSDDKILSLIEKPGPRLHHEDLTPPNPYKLEVDLRNPTNPVITMKVIGSTIETKCKDITNLTQALDDFRTGEFERNRIQELSREISQLKSDRDTQIQALNERLSKLNKENSELINERIELNKRYLEDARESLDRVCNNLFLNYDYVLNNRVIQPLCKDTFKEN